MKATVRNIEGFGYVVERGGQQIASRRYNPNDASSIVRARDAAEAIRSGIAANPARASLITASGH
mgnify:CR=1 FL=1